MSMVEKLKKYRLTQYLYNKKSQKIINTDLQKRKLNLPKSNSFSIKTESNNKNIIPLLTLKSPGNNSTEKIRAKLRNKNTQLKLNLTKMQKELLLAKSAEHKKIFELKKKEKLLNNAINIKKLALETDQDNFLSSFSFNLFQKEKEKEIIQESFKSNLLYKIKTQYINLEKENQKKINEISLLKNNIKHCKNKELFSKNQKIFNRIKKQL